MCALLRQQLGEMRTLQCTNSNVKVEDRMAYLVTTSQGLQEILKDTASANTHVWCSVDALTEAEFEKLERRNVTRFTYSLENADKATIQRALSTIEEHHPDECIWVESTVFNIM
jgi:hypothetical protein